MKKIGIKINIPKSKEDKAFKCLEEDKESGWMILDENQFENGGIMIPVFMPCFESFGTVRVKYMINKETE